MPVASRPSSRLLQLDAAVKLSELGVVGVDEHGAARRVLADESSLRAAIDLDRFHVEIGLVLEIAGERRRAIPIDHDTRWDVDVDLAAPETADVEHVRRTVLSDGDGRCRVLQGVQIRDALVFEQVLVQHRGGDAGRLQVLAAALRGHDDFFEPSVSPRPAPAPGHPRRRVQRSRPSRAAERGSAAK